jgi:TrmH family RNA methyltransferase
MISKAKIKLIRSLENKKARRQEGLFVAEGPKVVGELMAVRTPRMIVATEAWADAPGVLASLPADTELVRVTDDELRKASFLQHPQQVLGLFALPQCDDHTAVAVPAGRLCLALDGVQDPGNVGTIIRIADWYGIDDIFCSDDTADVYNPKVVQATMGSLARVNVVYTDLNQLADTLPPHYPVYGTLLEGQNIYGQELTDEGLIIMGNEGNGISPALRQRVNRQLLIPHYPEGRASAESLNVAIATAITCAEFRRRTSWK